MTDAVYILLHVLAPIQYGKRTFIVSVLPTFQMKPINHVRFNDNVNIWDTWKFMMLIMADRDTVMSVCDHIGLFLLSALPVTVQIQQILQISEQHQSSPPVSNASCGSRKLTLLYCLVLSLLSKFEQRYKDPQKVINQRNCIVCLATTVAAQVLAIMW